MEVKPGYNQTEVGILPEDWKIVELNEAARVVDSLHQTPSFAEDGYPMVRVTDIKTGNLSFVGTLLVTEAVFAEFTKNYKPKRGDIVLSRVGSYGVSSFVDTDERFCLGQNTVVLQPNLPPRFLYYVLNSNSIRRQIEDGSYGSGYKSLSLKNIKELRIPLPPTDHEQRAIATALSDVDALLGGLDRLIAKKRDLKQAVMQQLLTGQTRLPGFHGEWEVKRLVEVGDIRSGGTPSTSQSHFWDGDIPWCTPTDITALLGRKYLAETARTISATGLQSSSVELIPPRSLIMTSRATIGECAINLIPMTTNQGFKNIVPSDKFDIEFLYYLMATQKNRLIALCGGSTFLEIGKKQLSAYEITLPKDRDEQIGIAAVLSDMDAELAALEARCNKTRDLKQAVMQELLTGKTRLVPVGATHA